MAITFGGKGRLLSDEQGALYQTPITLAEPSNFYPNQDKDVDAPLTPMYGVTVHRRGVVNPALHKEPFRPYPWSGYNEANPDDKVSVMVRAGDGDVDSLESVKDSGENFRWGEYDVPGLKESPKMFGAQSAWLQPRVDLRHASGAGRIIGAHNALQGAMGDLSSFVENDGYYSRLYEYYSNDFGVDPRKTLRNDASVLKNIMRQSGDLRSAYIAALKSPSLSPVGKQALYALIQAGPFTDDYSDMKENSVNRFFNAYDEAVRRYDVRDGEQEQDEVYDNPQFATPAQKSAVMNRSGLNSYSRGGRLRVPKRNSYGDRVSRADNLGTDDYDVYF